MPDQPIADAGWYPHGNGQRYWDGAAWTDQAVAAPPSPPAAGPAAYGSAPTVVAPKNPAVALLAAFFVPGLGSMVNGEVGKGVGILIGYLVSFALAFVLIGIPFMIGFWIWGMVDGYQGAQRWNARHGIVS